MSINPDPSDTPDYQTPSNSLGSSWPSIRERYLHGGRSKMEARYDAVETLRDSYHLLTVEETDALLLYDEETGLYSEEGGDLIREYLERALGPAFSRTEAKEVLYRLKSRNRVSVEDLNSRPGHVCLLNGVLDVTDPANPVRREHSPEYHFTTRLPVEYDPEAGCPRWESFLEESVHPVDRLKLQEYAGYLLHHWGVPHNRFLMLSGPTNSGKSTWTNVLTSAIGEEHVSNESLQRLADDKHATAQLEGAWLNTCMDLDRVSPRGLGRLKQLASGDGVTVERKYATPYSTVLPAKHVFAANDLPDLPREDEAFHERALHVIFPRTVPRRDRDPDLADKLQEEAPGILNWMLEGYARLMEQSRFTGERSLEDKEALWRAHGDSVGQAIEAGHILLDPEAETPKVDVRAAFEAACEEMGLPRVGVRELGKQLKEYGVEATRPQIEEERVRCYRGVAVSPMCPMSFPKVGSREGGEEEEVLADTLDKLDREVAND